MVSISNCIQIVKVDGSSGRPLIITDENRINSQYESYLHDESKVKSLKVEQVAFPTSFSEVSRILADWYQLDKLITVSSARTGLVAGGVPIDGGGLLSIEKLSGIQECAYDDKEDCYFVRLGCGTKLYELNEYLANYPGEIFFPVDPTETSAAFGGMLGTNASGARSFYYGSIRDWVRWLRVVLPDGKVLEIKRGEHIAVNGEFKFLDEEIIRVLKANPIPKPLTKNTIGYHYHDSIDLIDVFIGSEGTLGVFTEVELKLAPIPKNRLYYLQFFDSREEAFNFVSGLKKTSLKALAVEYFDSNSLLLVKNSPVRESCRAVQMIKDSFKAGIFCDIAFEKEEEFEQAYECITELVSDCNQDIEESLAGVEDKDIRDIKTFRHAIPETINAIIAKRKQDIPELHKISTDMAVPAEKFMELHDLYCKTLNENNLEHYIFGHIGNNHVHVNIIPRSKEEQKLAIDLYEDFAREVVAWQGAVAAEHGIGRLKKEFFKIQYSPEIISNMRDIKKFFDPKMLLGRGVLFDAS